MNKRKLQGEEHTDEPETGSSKKLKESATMAESTSVDNQNSKPSASAKSESKQRKNTTPIHRGKFKSRWLSKHSSLLKRSRNANGLLVQCQNTYCQSISSL
jgi:hypothetical protein